MNAFRNLARRAETLATRTALEAALRIAAERTNLAPADVLAPIDPNKVRHGRPEAVAHAHARRMAIYCTATLFDRPNRQIARAAGISRQLVDRFVGDVEETRSDARFDRELDEIELDLMGAA